MSQKQKLNVGFIGVDQICFTGDKTAEFQKGLAALGALQKELGFTLTPYSGTIITREQADEAAVFFKKAETDFLLVQNSSFAAGETILPLAKTGIPLGLWAVPEPAAKGTLPLNSLCGVNMYASIIKNYLKEHSLKYKYFFGYGDEFANRFRITVRALTAIKRMRRAKVALVGGIAPGFNDLYFDERIIEKKLGVNVQRNHEYADIKDTAMAYPQDDIQEYIAESLSGYCSLCEGADENIQINARFLKAYNEFAEKNGYEALAVSCWPKIQADFLACNCHSMAKLNQRGVIASCEGDLPGALGMLMLRYLSDEKPVTLLDLVACDEQDDTLQLWHCGPTAEYFAGAEGVRMGTIEEDTPTPGKRRYLRYTQDMTFRAGAATVSMFCDDFDNMFVAGGAFIDYPKDRYNGSAGWLGKLTLNRRPITARNMLHTILSRGVQHHYPVAFGDCTKELMEVSAWLGMGLIQEAAYEDYLIR